MKAPFTEDDVKKLNFHQTRGDVHPYTCPGHKIECRERRELIATKDGWICKCGEYKQNWAH